MHEEAVQMGCIMSGCTEDGVPKRVFESGRQSTTQHL